MAPGIAERRVLHRLLTPIRRAPASLAPVPGLLTFHRTIGMGSHELVAWEWGHGPAVMLLHDWNGQASDLVGWVPALTRAGYRVLAADLPAHGHSSGWQASVLDWRRAVHALARYAGPVHAVIGQGLGATAAVLAAAQGANPRRLVLLAPGVDPAAALRAQALAEGLSPPRAEGVLRRFERHVGVSLETLDVRRAERELDRPVLRLPGWPNAAGIPRVVNFLRQGEARALPEAVGVPYCAAVEMPPTSPPTQRTACRRSIPMATKSPLTAALKPARVAPLAQAALRHGVSWLSHWAPALAERAVLLMFMTPPRRFPRQLPEVPGLTPHRTTLRSGRYRIGAWEWGQGPAVLLIHGWGGQASQWVPFVRPLVAAGHRVIAPDLPAHGFSSGRRATLPDFVQAVGTVAWHAGRVQGIVAHSLGATATALALARGLPAQRVVLIAPPMEVPYYVRRLAAWMHLPGPRTDGLLRRVARRVGMALDALDLRHVAPTLSTPALVVHSRNDREVPFAHGESIAAAWPGAILLPLEGSGHTRVLEDPAVVAAAVEFVQAAPAPAEEPAHVDDGDRVPYRTAL